MGPNFKLRQSDTGTKEPSTVPAAYTRKENTIIFTSFGPIECANLYDHQQSSSLILGPY